uniref:NADH-ubiquinone oxidoreductase chain 6 n=1 Tax=Larimichthys polyactis TaxID=334908 RepID=D2SRD9_LARPO|nr:NADH dehydrogenase subunit 6 [Larimichthys polyactis]ACL93173.1 NADH dehydrogenase subunit 6 [Larimichthys polyactis]
MTYIMSLFLFGLVLGLVAVASNPSPYFAALGLVVVAGLGCGILVGHGGHFLSLILFLIYLGGMLVVFAYSAALAAEPYPESWGSRSVMVYILVYVVGVVMVSGLFWGGWYETSWVPVDELGECLVLLGGFKGECVDDCLGRGMLVISTWVCFNVFVALEMTRGLSRGALRAV